MSDIIIDQVGSSEKALRREFDIIAHNLANVNTPGYKRRCNAFSKAVTAQEEGPATGSTSSVNLDVSFDFSQGSVIQTGRPLDFALYGKGFFVIETPEGPLYTRNGMFRTNQNGQIVDFQGRIVAGQGGPITMPTDMAPSQLHVSSDGSISAGGAAVGKFKFVDFKDNENKLVSVGASCFQMPDEDINPAEAEQIVVKQGFQEVSNVKMVEELVDMIMVSRLYEANMKFISARMQNSSSIISVAMG